MRDNPQSLVSAFYMIFLYCPFPQVHALPYQKSHSSPLYPKTSPSRFYFLAKVFSSSYLYQVIFPITVSILPIWFLPLPKNAKMVSIKGKSDGMNFPTFFNEFNTSTILSKNDSTEPASCLPVFLSWMSCLLLFCN